MNYISKNIRLLRKVFKYSQKELAAKMGIAKSTVSGFEIESLILQDYHILQLEEIFGVTREALTSGDISIKDAQEAYFKKYPPVEYTTGQEDVGAVMDDTAEYNESNTRNYVGKIIDQILTKHRTPKREYAMKGLGIGLEELKKIIAGEIDPKFTTVLKIAEDHGESLDMFRRSPLPPEHYLTMLSEKDRLIAAQQEIIDLLKKNSA